MARNGSGAMSIVNTLGAGAEILSASHNQNYADIAAEISNSLALDGQSTMTGQSKAANGTVGVPSQTFGGDLDTGRYHKAADTMADVCGGAEVQEISTTGVAVTGTHSASGLSSGLGHVPIGTVVDYAGLTEPTGWLFLNGATFLRTLPLFAVIGTQYGTGNGTTTATLPDCRGRVVAGQDDMGGSSADRLTGLTGGVDGDTLGAVGGAETDTLTTAKIPVHLHDAGTLVYSATVPNTGWGGGAPLSPTHGVNAGTLVAGRGVAETGETLESITESTTSVALTGPTAGVAGSTANAGGGGAHNNVQPTIILNKIIFAGI